MRAASRRGTIFAVSLLAGSVLLVPEAPNRPVPVSAMAPPDSDYRMGYAGTERPTLLAVAPDGTRRPLLEEDEEGDADLAPDSRAGKLVWVSRRAASGGADLAGGLYLRRPGQPPFRLPAGTGPVSQPALSPDGNRVAFTSDQGGSSDIWLIQTDGSRLRRLTDHPGTDTEPSWSPDGRRIAFSSTRDDPAGDIYLLDVANGRTTRLTSDPGADREPAWSPDGGRIAFTTSRFAAASAAGAASEVVTVPVGGGPVTRMVPQPWDSAEPAWSPDGRKLAFTTTHLDNAGDIYVVESGRVSPLAATSLAEREPGWAGSEVIYRSTSRTGRDVWSADRTGGDRRDHTARPGYDESGPAFSPDGTRLAYSAEQSGGGARIVVADASGRDPQILNPPGTLDSDRDTDPTWSPDGTAVAFTRTVALIGPDLAPVRPAGIAPGDSRVLVVSVADNTVVAELPMPAYLVGQDGEPAWSPDGTRIAVSRRAFLRHSDLGAPRIDRRASPGGGFTAEQTVATPAIPPLPDIVFLVDNTTSMRLPEGDGVIDQLKRDIPKVIASVRQEQPEAWFGLATFGSKGDPQIYEPRQALVKDDKTIQDAINGLTANSEYPIENWFYALRQVARNDRMGFRASSSKIVVLVSDAWSQDQNTPDGQPITVESLGADLVNNGIYLLGVPVVTSSAEEGLNHDGVAGQLAQRTGGHLTDDSKPNKLIEAIIGGIRKLQLTVNPVVENGCDPHLTVTFEPEVATVPAGDPARFAEQVAVAPDAVPGSELHCTVHFALNPPQPGADNRQDLLVRVNPPDLPLVQVDDVTVNATDPTGARVTYQASASDAEERPLPTRCAPASGSVFPIGQTVVTCTAVDAAGRQGRDTASITVVGPTTGQTRIWVTGLDGKPSGPLAFTDQVDLSARVTEPCSAGQVDRGPAWSPDGRSLAFAAGDGDNHLCVVNADGSGARLPIDEPSRQDERLADPAWTPDGARIAYSVAGRAGNSIMSVPSGGGTPTTLVRDVGAQPAFQSLPTPDLTVTVSVGNQPAYVGGDPVPIRVTVRNDSRLPAENVWLDLGLPSALLPAATSDPRCTGTMSLCLLGTLKLGDQQVVDVVLPARAAVATDVLARVSATVREVPTSRTATRPVRVLQPALTVQPTIGPPGFVALATGVNFPPGARVRLGWAPGITARPDTVVVAADGTIRAQVLVLRKDVLGPRVLEAVRVSGTPFGPVRTTQPFLVVPRSLDPPLFEDRG